MLKAAIVDLDGVIINSHPAHQRVWRQFLLAVGRAVSDEKLEVLRDGRRQDDIFRYFLGGVTE